MEPSRQVEIQLGHLCTNRCVFCVSGQRTAEGTAGVLETGPILERITEAFRSGNRKITLLGGEPTLQPSFMEVIRRCVEVGYEEIVIFTNGVRTARASFVDEVLATGGRFTWRLSVQGADKETHERTTRRPGSFARILRTLEHLAAKDQHVTVNTCIVKSNWERVDLFPELLLPLGVRQLHLDMMRPRDAGSRSEAELAGSIPRYSDMAPTLSRMVAGFESRKPGFDVNVGNLPQCIALEIAPWIHHDGEATETFAIDGEDRLSSGWNKYEVKAQDKVKAPGCRGCLFEAACSGVYQAYAGLHGLTELVKVTEAALAKADPERRLLPLHLQSRRQAVVDADWPGSLGPARWTVTSDQEVTILLEGLRPLAVSLRPPNQGGIAGCDLFSLHLRLAPADRQVAMKGLAALFDRLSRGSPIRHPLGEDALIPLSGSLRKRLSRLRRAAPFPHLSWTSMTTGPGRVELRLTGPEDQQVLFWLDERDGKPSGGYRLIEGASSPGLVEGLRSIMAAVAGSGP